MMLPKKQLEWLENCAKTNFATLGYWTEAFDFVGFIVGRESSEAIKGLCNGFTREFGLSSKAGRLDDVGWDDPLHSGIEWVVLDMKIPCPGRATVNGARIWQLPQFVEVSSIIPRRRFAWKYSSDNLVALLP